MKNVLFLMLPLVLFFLASCEKDAIEPTKTDILTNAAWKITSMTIADTDGTEFEIIGDLESCELDNLHYFKSTGSFVINENTLKCEDEDPQEYAAGSWALSQNDTKIVISVDDESKVCDILHLDANKIKFKYVETDEELTSTYSITMTAVK